MLESHEHNLELYVNMISLYETSYNQAENVWRTRQYKDIMRDNRLHRDRQYKERFERDAKICMSGLFTYSCALPRIFLYSSIEVVFAV